MYKSEARALFNAALEAHRIAQSKESKVALVQALRAVFRAEADPIVLAPVDQLRADLLNNKEGCVSTKADGSSWCEVYLENLPARGLSARQVAGYLSALQARGLYKRIDGTFGEVKIG